MTDIRIRKTDWAQDSAKLSALRRSVFIEEQHVPEDMEWDEHDATCTHFLACDSAGDCLGCVRLLATGQISRLCVREDRRSEGVGRRLLEAAVTEARACGLREIFLHAQTHATSFYESAGFLVDGGIFVEAGIPHRLMVKTLG
jgi:predicted GNAT family N-acyltransferase